MTHSPNMENRDGTMDEYEKKQLQVWADESCSTIEEKLEQRFRRLEKRKEVIQQKLHEMAY